MSEEVPEYSVLNNRFMNRTSATTVIYVYLLVHALSTILCYFLIS